MEKGTISFLNLKKSEMYFNDNKIKNDVLISDGEIFNIPFNITWKKRSKYVRSNNKFKIQ